MIQKTKIAVYSGEIPSTTFIERLIRGLSDQGYQVLLFGYLKKKIRYNNSNIFVAAYTDNRIQKLFHLFKYSLLLSLFKREAKKKLDDLILKKEKNKTLLKIKYYPILWHQPDVFHLQWAKSIGDWIWVQDFGIKLIVSLRGVHINYTPITHPEVARMYKECFPKVDGFHAVSKGIALEALKYGATIDKIKVVYSGLDYLKDADAVAKNKKFTLLSVGRSHWVKGYSSALAACKILKDAGFEFEYKIIGGKNSEELIYLRDALQLQEEVVLSGNVAFAAVQEQMQRADVVLLPSVEEGIANVVLEAMQLGTLVLSTDCGGMSEVIKDGKNGFIVPIRDPHKMALRILEIAQLSATAKKNITTAARVTIDEQHTTEKMILDMVLLYKNALDQ